MMPIRTIARTVPTIAPPFPGDRTSATHERSQMKNFTVSAVGRVSSSLTDLESAPRQADEGAPEAWLVFEEEVREALRNIRAGDTVIVLTWLDRARRDVL